MKTLPARDVSEEEAPFRAPEALAMAMPLIAVSGLVVVVSAVALGATGRVVASLAVAGFGLCAVAPMALIEAFVSRPLRGALAQLRAARDGRSLRGPAFASGVLADLVHIARDLQAAQANGNFGFPPPDFAAAHQDAARALSQQAESLIEAAAQGESRINRAAQVCFADIAQALKSMRDAPILSGFDGAVERLESMLVYIAEAQERAEAKDRQFEGAFGRVEVGMADLARLVARETDTVQGALSSHGLLVRNDVADAVAQEKSGRARVLERLDTLETRLAKGADGVAREVAGLAEAGRRAPRLAGEGRLDEIAAALSRLENEMAQALARPAVAEALTGLGARMAEDLAAQFRDADLAGLKAQIETLRSPAAFERDDGAPQWTALAADLNRQWAEIGARLDAAQTDASAHHLAQAARGLIETTERLETQWTQVPPGELDATVARALAPFADRLEAKGETDAGRFDALCARIEQSLQALASAALPDDVALERWSAPLHALAHRVEALDGRLSPQAPDGFAQAAETLGALARRIETALARQATPGEDARHLADTVKSALAAVAARTELAAQRQDEKLDDFAERTIDPARDALAGAARDFAAAAADFAAVRARFEAGEPTLARIEEATQGARARLDALASSLPGAFAQTVEAHVERLAERLDAASLAPARDAFAQAQGALSEAAATFGSAQGRLVDSLAAREADGSLAARATADLRRQIDERAEAIQAQTAEGFSQAQARLAEVAARIEVGDPRMTAVAGVAGGLREQIDGLAATLRAQADELAAQLDAGALTPAREALAQAAAGFAAAQGRLAEAADKIEAGDPRFEAVLGATGGLRQQVDGLAATLRAQAEELAARLDAGALTPAREALAQAAEGFAAAQGRLAQAADKIEAGDPRMAAVAGVAGGLREQIDNLAETLRAQADELAARLYAGALTPAREALAQAAEGFAAAQGRLGEAAGKIEAGDPRVAQVADAAKALRADFAVLAQSLPDALWARVSAAGLDPAREALAQAERAFDAARVRLDGGCENLGRLRGDFVVSEARFGRLLEETVTRLAALGFERLPDLMDDLAAMKAQWGTRLAEFDRSALILAGLADTDARDLTALRDAFASAERDLGAAIAALAPGFEAAVAAQGDRIARALETSDRQGARDREGARELETAIARVADLPDRLENALAQARPPEGLEALRADLAASAQSVASGFRDAVEGLARRIEDRLEGLRRGDFAPAALALQASTQDLGKAHAELFAQVDALKAALGGDSAAFAALRLDVVQTFASVAAMGERAEASIRDAAERTDVLSLNVGALVGAERAELAAVAQALARIGERVEYAARAFEDRRGGDLVTLGADLTRDIDALARATAERVLALEGGVETLAQAAGATLSQLREATRDLRALMPPASAAVERPLQAEDKAGKAAVSRVASTAGALHERFSQIEAALATLSARLIGEDPGRLDADIAALVTELQAASRALKSGLSDFAGVSAARVEDFGARAAEATPPSTASFQG